MKFVKRLPFYSVALGSEKRAGKNSDAVGSAFAVLECAIKRGDELKLPLNSCTEGPQFANALLCFVAGGYAELCSPQYPRRRLKAPKMLPVLKSGGSPVPLREERCSTDIRDYYSKRNVVQRHNTLDETGAVFWRRKVRADARSYLQRSKDLTYPTRPRNRLETPKEKLCKRWPLLTARPQRRRDFLALAFAVQVRNGLGKAGRAVPVSLLRVASRTAESASPCNFFLSPGVGCWPWNHPPGDQCPTLIPGGWIHPKSCCQSSKSDFFMAGFCENLA